MFSVSSLSVLVRLRGKVRFGCASQIAFWNTHLAQQDGTVSAGLADIILGVAVDDITLVLY